MGVEYLIAVAELKSQPAPITLSATICTKADCSPPIHHNGFHAIAMNDDFNKFYSVHAPYRSSVVIVTVQ